MQKMQTTNNQNIDPGIMEELERNARKLGYPDCKRGCRGMGFYFDPFGGGKRDGAFVLCDCMKEVMRCEGQPPFEYFDSEENGMRDCPTKPVLVTLERIALLRKYSGIPSRYNWKFISSIDFTPVMFAMDHAVETVRLFGEGKSQGIYFHGGTGSGKTLLSCAILNELIRLYQKPVKYAKISRDILGKLRASFNPNSDSYGEGRKIEEELARIPVLVIDDFGVHRESEWVNSVLYDLIDARYENNLLTIITSNEPMSSWKEIGGGRVYSRLVQMCLEIHIDAPDYRLNDQKSF